MEKIQKSKLTDEELDNIKQLLLSADVNNRELGIILALNNGISVDELVDKIVDEHWFYDSYDNYDRRRFEINTLPDYKIKNYTIRCYREMLSELHFTLPIPHLIKESDNIKELVKEMILRFMYPERYFNS